MIRHFRGITTRRVASLSLAAALGVWLGAMMVDKVGTTPLFLLSAIGLPLLALDFRRRLARRAAATA